VILAYHGYPTLIHKLTYRRAAHEDFHVHGFREEGTTTTPFDMVMMNGLDRFSLARAVIDRVPGLLDSHAELRAELERLRAEARAYTREHGDDLPSVHDWVWPG
jgi:xylulose-5-phosphate/fructose-6-phosphate phosphoketolase